MSRVVTFGQMLRQFRFDYDKSQSDLVTTLGLASVAYLSDLENDRRPPPKYDILVRIIKKLNFDPLETLNSCAYSLRYMKEIKKNANSV